MDFGSVVPGKIQADNSFKVTRNIAATPWVTDPSGSSNAADQLAVYNEVMLRPEAGSYTANLSAAKAMFTTRLYDRLGETQYTDALTGEKKVTSL